MVGLNADKAICLMCGATCYPSAPIPPEQIAVDLEEAHITADGTIVREVQPFSQWIEADVTISFSRRPESEPEPEPEPEPAKPMMMDKGSLPSMTELVDRRRISTRDGSIVDFWVEMTLSECVELERMGARQWVRFFNGSPFRWVGFRRD